MPHNKQHLPTGGDNELLLVAAVVWDIQRGGVTSSSSSHTSKVRVYEQDIADGSSSSSSSRDDDDDDGRVLLRGRDLQRILMLELEHTILGQPLPDEHDNNASVEMDVYDTSKSAYVPLAGNLLQEDIVQRMGTRLRMHVRVVSSNSHNNIHNNDTNGIDENDKPKAILGRFYSYNASQGLTLAGAQLCVQEIPNQENAGTGVNVWDGALLL